MYCYTKVSLESTEVSMPFSDKMPYLCLRLFVSRVQDTAFPIVGLREVHLPLFLQYAKVPLKGSTNIWCNNHSFKHYTIILLRVCSLPLSKSLIKMLNSFGQGIGTLITLLVASLLLIHKFELAVQLVFISLHCPFI